MAAWGRWPVAAVAAGAALGLAGLAWQGLLPGGAGLAPAIGPDVALWTGLAVAAVLLAWLGSLVWRQSRTVAGQALRLQQQQARLQALGRSEEQLRQAEQVAELGSFDWDPDSGALHWSDGHFRLWGHAPGALTPDYAAFRARVHPDDLGALEARLQHSLQTGSSYACTHRVCWPDGTVREVLARAVRSVSTAAAVPGAWSARCRTSPSGVPPRPGCSCMNSWSTPSPTR